jgi:YbgC/YbaW family acyl-CoA thioester hydrolase
MAMPVVKTGFGEMFMIQNKIERQIMWGDLDSMGIVYYPRYYEWIDGCTHLFFEKIFPNWAELCETRQIMFGLRKTSCEYFSPGRYHQKILITTQIENIEKKMLILKHIITSCVNNRIMVRGIEKRVCMDVKDPAKLKAVNIPEDINKILTNVL